MRWGILVNLAVILIVSGALLFVVFLASTQRTAAELRVSDCVAASSLIEDAIRNAKSRETLWETLRAVCRSRGDVGVELYDSSGSLLLGCGLKRNLEQPAVTEYGRKLRILSGNWPRGLFRPVIVLSDLTKRFPFDVRTVRTFIEIPPTFLPGAGRFFGAYLILTHLALFFLGYVLFHRTVIGPIREVERLATKARGVADFQGPPQLPYSGGDIQRITASLRSVIVKMVEDRDKMQELIDRLRRAHEELSSAQQSLVRSEKLACVGRLAAGLSHEIGNPLQILMGYVELLQRSPDPESEADVIRRMDQELTRIHEILRGLLDFARPAPPRIGDCDLKELIRDCGSLVAGRKGFRRLEFQYEADTDLPLVRTDQEKVRQIIVNLLFNAADAIPESGGLITLAARKREPWVDIEIRDTGQGIAEEDLDKVFDPFFTTKEPGKGTGLGLAVCQGLVESLGGTLNISSSAEDGTTVVVSLPFVSAS